MNTRHSQSGVGVAENSDIDNNLFKRLLFGEYIFHVDGLLDRSADELEQLGHNGFGKLMGKDELALKPFICSSDMPESHPTVGLIRYVVQWLTREITYNIRILDELVFEPCVNLRKMRNIPR